MKSLRKPLRCLIAFGVAIWLSWNLCAPYVTGTVFGCFWLFGIVLGWATAVAFSRKRLGWFERLHELLIVLAATIVCRFTAELGSIPEAGWSSKAMRAEAVQQGIPASGVESPSGLDDVRDRFFRDQIAKFESERNALFAITVVLCLFKSAAEEGAGAPNASGSTRNIR